MRSGTRALRIVPASMSLLLLVMGGVAMAQDEGSVEKGRIMAEQICASCHAVRANETASPIAEAPRFALIANVPGMSAIALNVALNTSHKSMPNFMLDAQERRDIAAYILSLKNR